MLQRFDEHSIETDLLKGGAVLDVGCRGFGFARAMAERGCRVIALDPNPEIIDPEIPGVTYLKRALVSEGHRSSTITYEVVLHDRAANFVWMYDDHSHHRLHRNAQTFTVPTINLTELMISFGITQWDAIKLDCEGSEYPILLQWPGPIAKQVSIEFHEHVCPRGLTYIDKTLVPHLGQWYVPVKHELGLQHGLPDQNYWDSLFVLK